MMGGAHMQEYNRCYRIAFEYHKKYAPFPATLEAWDTALKDMFATYQDGGETEFLRELLYAVFGEFERRYRAAQQ